MKVDTIDTMDIPVKKIEAEVVAKIGLCKVNINKVSASEPKLKTISCELIIESQRIRGKYRELAVENQELRDKSRELMALSQKVMYESRRIRQDCGRVAGL